MFTVTNNDGLGPAWHGRNVSVTGTMLVIGPAVRHQIPDNGQISSPIVTATGLFPISITRVASTTVFATLRTTTILAPFCEFSSIVLNTLALISCQLVLHGRTALVMIAVVGSTIAVYGF
jgi:hypothetical protein